MLVNKFDFDLPKTLIADFPVEPRDSAKLLAYNKNDDSIKEEFFYNLPNYLNENDVLVLNNTKVIPARLKIDSFSRGEIFFVELENGLWKTMVRPGRKFKIGGELVFGELEIQVMDIDSDGFRYLKTNFNETQLLNYLEKHGNMPVPPYISGESFKEDDYNTVFSQKRESIAAPTAGLHFTEELIENIKAKGVKVEFVSLGVGLGTFLPIKVADSKDHKMHSEKYEISPSVAARLNEYVKHKKRIIAVGTTSIRVLEDNFRRNNYFTAGKFSTDIFIEPGYQWCVVDAIITNFHLPKSTLIMLVSAFIGLKKTLQLYKFAIKNKYRFYSFGDGMFLR